MSSTQGTYAYTVNQTVQYGPGITHSALPKLLTQFGCKKAFIVCGKSLKTKTGVIDEIVAILGKSHHGGTFSDIGQHAPIEGIEKALEAFKETGSDCLISVGGGSPIDACKAMSFFHHQHSSSSSPDEKEGGLGKSGLSAGFLPHIAIPTTLSAAEFTPMSGFTKNGKKTGVADAQLAPTGVILDAKWSLETPLRLWLTTGMRAMDHAVETLYRPYAPPFIRTLAYSAIKDLFAYLPKCRDDPSNLETRQLLQLAAWHSLFPYRQEDDAKSTLGLSHALGYMIGAPYSVPHGLCSCITLGPVIRYKATHLPPPELARLAEIQSLLYKREGDSVATATSTKEQVFQVADLVDGLVKDLGCDQGLQELGGIGEDQLPGICTGAGLQKEDERKAMIDLLKAKL